MTFAELMEAWRARDVRYSRAGRHLSEREVAVVRLARNLETIDLPTLADRIDARSIATTWDPPGRE